MGPRPSVPTFRTGRFVECRTGTLGSTSHPLGTTRRIRQMNQNPGVYGRKLGCTQLFTEDGSVQRVTVIEAGPLMVIGKRTKEKDGYVALIVGLGERKEKHTSKPLAGYYKKANA